MDVFCYYKSRVCFEFDGASFVRVGEMRKVGFSYLRGVEGKEGGGAVELVQGAGRFEDTGSHLSHDRSM